MRRLLVILAASGVLGSCGGGDSGGGSGSVPALDHVIVIVMENKSDAQARTGTYTASLIARGASFSSYFAITHPSQPNYLVLWSGQTQGVTSDSCPAPGSPFDADNLGHACEAAGLTWRAYAEDLPGAGSTVCSANGGLYVRWHAPWTYFSNVSHANERPYSDLAADLAGGTLPDLAFVVPNKCHDTHDCSLAQGDQWLADHVPAMLAGVGPRGIVVLTWDEDDDHSRNHILTVIMGDPVKSGHVSSRAANHYTLVRTICIALGLSELGDARLQQPITDIWSGLGPGNATITGPAR